MAQKNSFADLEKVKLEILEEKIVSGIIEIEMNKGQQWASIKLEKPLLDKLLKLVQEDYHNK